MNYLSSPSASYRSSSPYSIPAAFSSSSSSGSISTVTDDEDIETYSYAESRSTISDALLHGDLVYEFQREFEEHVVEDDNRKKAFKKSKRRNTNKRKSRNTREIGRPPKSPGRRSNPAQQQYQQQQHLQQHQQHHPQVIADEDENDHNDDDDDDYILFVHSNDTTLLRVKVRGGGNKNKTTAPNDIPTAPSDTSQNSVFYVPVSLMITREKEMRETSRKLNMSTKRWNGSLLYRQWKEHYLQRGVAAVGAGGAAATVTATTEATGSGELTIILDPEMDCAITNYSHSFKWLPWLTYCIRSYYNTGTIRIPDETVGSDILLALEYFSILYSPKDQLVFDSYTAYIRVKLWSDYFTHRSTMATWVTEHIMYDQSSRAKHTHTFCTTPHPNEFLDGKYVHTLASDGSNVLTPFQGGMLLEHEQEQGGQKQQLHSCQIVHGFFNNNTNNNNDSVTASADSATAQNYLQMDETMRKDFSSYLTKMLPGTEIKFTIKDVIVSRIQNDGMRQFEQQTPQAVLSIDVGSVLFSNKTGDSKVLKQQEEYNNQYLRQQQNQLKHELRLEHHHENDAKNQSFTMKDGPSPHVTTARECSNTSSNGSSGLKTISSYPTDELALGLVDDNVEQQQLVNYNVEQQQFVDDNVEQEQTLQTLGNQGDDVFDDIDDTVDVSIRNERKEPIEHENGDGHENEHDNGDEQSQDDSSPQIPFLGNEIRFYPYEPEPNLQRHSSLPNNTNRVSSSSFKRSSSYTPDEVSIPNRHSERSSELKAVAENQSQYTNGEQSDVLLNENLIVQNIYNDLDTIDYQPRHGNSKAAKTTANNDIYGTREDTRGIIDENNRVKSFGENNISSKANYMNNDKNRSNDKKLTQGAGLPRTSSAAPYGNLLHEFFNPPKHPVPVQVVSTDNGEISMTSSLSASHIKTVPVYLPHPSQFKDDASFAEKVQELLSTHDRASIRFLDPTTPHHEDKNVHQDKNLYSINSIEQQQVLMSPTEDNFAIEESSNNQPMGYYEHEENQQPMSRDVEACTDLPNLISEVLFAILDNTDCRKGGAIKQKWGTTAIKEQNVAHSPPVGGNEASENQKCAPASNLFGYPGLFNIFGNAQADSNESESTESPRDLAPIMENCRSLTKTTPIKERETTMTTAVTSNKKTAVPLFSVPRSDLRSNQLVHSMSTNTAKTKMSTSSAMVKDQFKLIEHYHNNLALKESGRDEESDILEQWKEHKKASHQKAKSPKSKAKPSNKESANKGVKSMDDEDNRNREGGQIATTSKSKANISGTKPVSILKNKNTGGNSSGNENTNKKSGSSSANKNKKAGSSSSGNDKNKKASSSSGKDSRNVKKQPPAPRDTNNNTNNKTKSPKQKSKGGLFGFMRKKPPKKGK